MQEGGEGSSENKKAAKSSYQTRDSDISAKRKKVKGKKSFKEDNRSQALEKTQKRSVKKDLGNVKNGSKKQKNTAHV